MSFEKTTLKANLDQESQYLDTQIHSLPTSRAPKFASTLGALLTSVILAILRHEESLKPHLPKQWTTTIAHLLPHTVLYRVVAGTVAVTIYCICIVNLFTEPRWRERYLPWMCWLVIVVLGMIVLVSRDVIGMFVDGLMGVVDFCVLLCLGVEVLG